MPARQRKPNELAGQAMPLLLLGMGLIASNRYVTFVDAEVRSLDAAAQPVRTLLASYLSGPAHADIPPLYGMVLHFWLRWTNWNFEYLRIPAIAFFLVGLFFLARAAHRFGGPTAASAAVWVGMLWPFGFHYGRLAAPYSFVFFLIAGLTFTYLRFLEKDNFERWAALFLFGVALLWTNAFGWAVLGCLAIDQVIRRRAGESKIPAAVLARTAILWIAAFVPLLRGSYGDWAAAIRVHHGFSSSAHQLRAADLQPVRERIDRAVAMAVECAGGNRRSGLRGHSLREGNVGFPPIFDLRLGPDYHHGRDWNSRAAPPVFRRPLGGAGDRRRHRLDRISLGAPELWRWPCCLSAGLAGTASTQDAFIRRPQFLEPWAQLAGEDAGKIQTGAAVVSNSRPFFLYLTYALQPPTASLQPILVGLLPDFAAQPAVKTAQQWLSAGHPMNPTMIWIHGADDPDSEAAMENAAARTRSRLRLACLPPDDARRRVCLETATSFRVRRHLLGASNPANTIARLQTHRRFTPFRRDESRTTVPRYIQLTRIK